MSEQFKNKNAVITGGTSGIGLAIAQVFVAGGGNVIITGRDESKGKTTGLKLQAENATVVFVAADLSTLDGARLLAKAVAETFESVNILVNNAGATKPYFGSVDSIPDEAWIASLNDNLMSAVRTTGSLLPLVKKSHSGTIINIASDAAFTPVSPLLHYSAAKAALVTYTKGLAQELAADKIRVNTVTPRPVRTPGGSEILEDIAEHTGTTYDQITAGIPMGRPGEPEEIARVVAFLASDESSWITGSNYFIDGGLTRY